MTTKSISRLVAERPKPLPEYRPLNSLLGPWLVRLAQDKRVHMIVTRDQFGAPAAFDTQRKTIMVYLDWVRTVRPELLSSAMEFVSRYPKIAGIILHELGHARFSPEPAITIKFKTMGDRCFAAFTLLEEGRAECLLWDHLNQWEREALRMMVMYVVMKDIDGEQEEADKMVADIRLAVRLLGFFAARVEAAILDMEQPKVYATWVGIVAALGEYFDVLYGLATEYSRIRIEPYTNSVDRMQEIVQQWVFIEDSIITQAKEQREQEQAAAESSEDGQPEQGESGSGEGESGSGEGESGGGTQEGQEEGQEGSEGQVGSDDEGTEGDGSHEAAGDGDGTANLGSYGASHRIDLDAIKQLAEEIEETLHEADQESRQVSGSRLRGLDRELHRATRQSHADRRANNKRVAGRWAGK